MALGRMTAPGRMAALAAVAFWPAFAADAVAQGSIESDRAALEALYDATGGASWRDSTNWKTSAPLNEWYGVTARWPGRVTGLDLRQNALTGSIPDALGNLSSLSTLSLYLNALTGPIPDALGSLASLEYLNLGGNELTGPIPAALGGLANLEYLQLGGTFTGPIPAALGSLASLEHLVLAGNGLTGSIPAALGNLANLKVLNLWGNGLTDSIPAALGSLASLERLDLRRNELTGPIPAGLGSLVNLWHLALDQNGLTGPIPAALGSLANLRRLSLSDNALSGALPAELGSLANLRWLNLYNNWGVSGPLPAGWQRSRLEELDVFYTQVCAPAGWRDWLATIEFTGGLCGTDFTIDVAVVYTPAAREAAGGTAAIAAVIDEVIASTNQAFVSSGVEHRLALVERSEVAYAETGYSLTDLRRLSHPSDGHLDEVHAMRDRVGADLVSLIVGESDVHLAELAGPFSVSIRGGAFAHELGHNMGLWHDRYQVLEHDGRELSRHPAYGYVNQRGLEAGAPPSSSWHTIMAYSSQCSDVVGSSCPWVFRFSNSRQRYEDDPLGVPFESGRAGVTGPADAAAVLGVTGSAVGLWRDRPAGANRPPVAVGTLPDRELTWHVPLGVDVSQAFVDPDGDALSYTVSSSSPWVATVLAMGGRVILTAVSAGTATIRVTATDRGGLSVSQLFAVTVPANRPPEPVGTLAPLSIGVDEAPVTVDVATGFRDPEGDALTYWARSSAPSVASVAVSGSTVTVMPLSEGMSTVTVTATDAGGSNGTARQTFSVTVGAAANRPPEAVGVLAPVTLGVDEAAMTIEVSGAFRDPDGDALTYRATSSPPGIASVVASGSAMIVTPVSEGTATVTVMATDPGGLSATQSFVVTVSSPANRPPEPVGALAPVTLGVDEAAVPVEVSGAFRDPDGDVLTYTATSSVPGVAAVSVSGSTVTVRPESEGTSTVTVTATDADGSNGAATQSFTVMVGPAANRPPVLVGTLPPLTIRVDEAAVPIDVSGAFRDPDGDALTYGARSSAPGVVAVTVSGFTVTVRPESEGTSTVTVTATDTGGSNETATQTFRVTVNPPANRPPEPVGRLAPLAVDEAAESVEVSGAFRDPDGDALTYTATSSVPGVAAVSVSGSVVTVTPLSEGTSTVTVTATDTGGSNTAATQSFTVTVGAPANRPPEPLGVLAPLTIGVDEASVTVEVSGAFRDPDGDELTYVAASSSPGVASVSVSGSVVTVTPLSEGTSTVTVRATDAGGSNTTATQAFSVTVTPPANRPPEPSGTLPPLRVGVDENAVAVDVSGAFRDPDGDRLTYAATSSSPGVASVSVSGSVVTVTPLSEGTSTVTVRATDAGGSNMSATQTFPVTVNPPANRPPEPVGRLAPLTLAVDEAAVVVEVSGAFRDPDGDVLTYAATSSSPGVASVSVSGSVVTVTPLSEGTSTVTVRATDTGGSNTAVTQRFTVTVTRPANRAPTPVGVLAPLTIGVDEAAVVVEVSGAFRDPDGDVLTYAAVSSAPGVASVSVSGSVVTVTPLSEGTSTVTVTATDTGGSNTAATQSFSVTVPRPFTDHPLVAGVTPVKAVHFTELRARIDALRRGAGLAPFAWTDRVLTAGVTRVRLAHLLELRSAVGEAYATSGRSAPGWTDAAPAGGATPIRAVHLMELRAAVTALEGSSDRP